MANLVSAETINVGALEICNRAIALVRGELLADYNELNNGISKEAVSCRQFYDQCRQTLLKKEAWGFATTIVKLVLDNNYTPKEWLYAYYAKFQTSTFIKINRIVPDIDVLTSNNNNNNIVYRNEYFGVRNDKYLKYKIPFDIQLDNDEYNSQGVSYILTNEENAYAEVVENRAVDNLWDMEAQSALTHLLASMIAIPISGHKAGREIASDNYSLYQAMIDQAVANNSIQKYAGRKPDSEMITVRNS